MRCGLCPQPLRAAQHRGAKLSAGTCIRAGERCQFYIVVDLVNRLEAEGETGRLGKIADALTQLDPVVLDKLGYLPSAQFSGHLLFHLISRLYERTSVVLIARP